MNNQQLGQLLQTTGFPVAYHHFRVGAEPAKPYVVFLMLDSDNFAADDKSYHKTANYQIELYTAVKDPAAEAVLETLLDNNSLYFNKYESYLDSEEMFMVAYQIEI